MTPRERKIFAELDRARPARVPIDDLVEAVYGAALPRYARQSVRCTVSRLRRKVAPLGLSIPHAADAAAYGLEEGRS